MRPCTPVSLCLAAAALLLAAPPAHAADALGACLSDQLGVAGPGTHICGVVVTRRRSASTPSSALQLHAPPLSASLERGDPHDPARGGRYAPRLVADLIRKTGPTCAAPDTRRFPLTTRIHGGPGTYEAGGGYGIWYLDLTNTTTRTCGNIHPVVVLVDDRHELTPSQPHLEFYDGTHPHPVQFETTDEDELVGPFDDGFPGFTVGPRQTVTVKIRLAITSDAAPNQVTADAAVVQRRGDDGDWVGQSNDYAFRIHNDASPTPSPAASGTGTTPPSRAPRLPFADELARTGLGTPGLALAAAAVLVTGGALLLARRQRRRR